MVHKKYLTSMEEMITETFFFFFWKPELVGIAATTKVFFLIEDLVSFDSHQCVIVFIWICWEQPNSLNHAHHKHMLTN